MKLKKKIILASQSQRREKLLYQIGINDFRILKHSINENSYKFTNPISKSIMGLAEMKAKSIKKSLLNSHTIISADTIVMRAGKFFHKANSRESVKKYLTTLSNKKHNVYGGICVLSDNTVFKRFVKTEVYFHKISEFDLSDEILDDGIGKAGGYAIQNHGAKFVRKIRGCYTNIVGISIPELYKILKSL